MKRNIIAIVAYPVIFCLIFAFESLNTEIFHITSVPAIVSHILFVFPFLLSPIVSAWIANKNPIRYSVLGSLLFLILIICFAPFVTRLLLTPIGPISQKLLATFPEVDLRLVPYTLQILSVMFSPVVILLAVIGGLMGNKVKSYFKIG